MSTHYFYIYDVNDPTQKYSIKTKKGKELLKKYIQYYRVNRTPSKYKYSTPRELLEIIHEIDESSEASDEYTNNPIIQNNLQSITKKEIINIDIKNSQKRKSVEFCKKITRVFLGGVAFCFFSYLYYNKDL